MYTVIHLSHSLDYWMDVHLNMTSLQIRRLEAEYMQKGSKNSTCTDERGGIRHNKDKWKEHACKTCTCLVRTFHVKVAHVSSKQWKHVIICLTWANNSMACFVSVLQNGYLSCTEDVCQVPACEHPRTIFGQCCPICPWIYVHIFM